MKGQTTKDIEKILVESVQNAHSVFMWKSLNGVIEKCELKLRAIRKEYGEVELEIIEKETKKLSDMMSGNREFNFYIPDSSVSFTTSLKNTIDEKKFKVRIPSECSFYERRKHERVQLQKAFISFEHNKVMNKKSLFDVSIGGFAFVLPKTEKMNLKKGMSFDKCVLEIGLRKMKVSIECTSAQTIDRFKLDSLPYGGFKIAFRFTSISKEDKDFLAEQITMKILQSKELKGA